MLLVQLTSQTMTGFVYPDYFGNVQVQAVASMLSMIPTFVLAAIVGTLSMKFGRKELAIGGSLFGAAVYAVMFFMQIKNAWLFAIMNAVAFCGLAFFSLICWAMITDVIDDTEVRTGVRSDGEIYSIYSFARKMGQAASSGVAGGLLTAIGYVSGSTVGQSAQVAQGIYNLSCGVPAIGFVLLAITLAFLYPLNKKRVNENVKALAAKRNAK